MIEYKKVDKFDCLYNGENLEIDCIVSKFGQTIYLGSGFTRARVLNPETLNELRNKQKIMAYGSEKITFKKDYEFGIFEFLVDYYKI